MTELNPSFFLDQDASLSSEEVASLFTATFQRPFNHTYWQWRFYDNPVCRGKPQIAYARTDGMVIAYYAVSPILVNAGGKVVKGALSNMTMTHPAFEGKGLFRSLAKLLYDVLEAEQYRMVLGFPNFRSHYSFVTHLGWRNISEVVLLILKQEVALAMIKKLDLSQTKVRWVDLSERIIEEISGSFAEGLPLDDGLMSARRDPEWLWWRIGLHPAHRYKVLTIESANGKRWFAIGKYYEDGFDLLEISGTIISSDGLASLCRFLFSEGVKFITTWLPLWYSEFPLYERTGFTPTTVHSYFCARHLGNSEALDTDRRRWRCSMLDSDVF
jgi:hypothetical protein